MKRGPIPDSHAPKRVLSIEIAYDGAGFLGWQIQPDARTVQGELTALCSRIMDHPVSLTGAGRTDTGVHARASLCSFETTSQRTAEELFRGLKRLVPGDILVRRVDERPEGFSARFSARAREYEYRLHRGASPFRRNQAWCTTYELNTEAMRQALTPLVGRQDCRAFCVSKSLPPAAWCEFRHAELHEEGPELIFRVSCDRFLHSMVRALAGTLHDIGRGRFSPDHLAELIRSGDRAACGQIAPPQGLYLDRVIYDDFATGLGSGGVPGECQGSARALKAEKPTTVKKRQVNLTLLTGK
jgi:tRNA pseudouridine38-40 synthase